MFTLRFCYGQRTRMRTRSNGLLLLHSDAKSQFFSKFITPKIFDFRLKIFDFRLKISKKPFKIHVFRISNFVIKFDCFVSLCPLPCLQPDSNFWHSQNNACDQTSNHRYSVWSLDTFTIEGYQKWVSKNHFVRSVKNPEIYSLVPGAKLSIIVTENVNKKTSKVIKNYV